ncbi:hypothetical protein [Paenibacillus jiagnxiensis]|uniref:hypothetical protein n=1 Tax=Paenibacillus jiagnxiensis TaxID=3228926 RepID=UPI0033AD88EE
MSESVRHVTGSPFHQFSRMELLSLPQCAGLLCLRAVAKLDSQIYAAIKKA